MKRTYNTFDNLVKNIEGEITLENLLHRRGFFNTGKEQGWNSFEIKEDIEYVYRDIVENLLGGNYKTQKRIIIILDRHGKSLNHWGLARISYDRKKKLWNYTAGADYPNEIKLIRNYLKE